MDEKVLILRLIRDNLVNTKLVNGLMRIDLCAENYSLILGDTILELMSIDVPDEEIERYILMFNGVNAIRIEDKEALEKLTLEIYLKLSQLKRK